MSRKLMVLGLAVVLVIAVAIPVVAQERVATPKLQKISKRALKQSRTALRTAREARLAAQRAQGAAGAAAANAASAVQTAGDAKNAAAGAQAATDATRVRAGTAAGTVFTESEEFIALPGGPSVEATVPASGLIEVWAQATIEGEGAVALFEDGKKVGGQAEFCGPEADPGALFAVEAPVSEPLVISTPAGAGPGICGSFGAPAPVLFQTSSGTHTYELRYADCGCGLTEATFSNRRLFVGPRL